MASKKSDNLNKAVSKVGKTVGRQDKLTKALIRAGSPKTRASAKNKSITYKDFLEITPDVINKMPTEELRAVVARLNTVERKRINNLKKYGYNTQAIRALEESGGKTSASKDLTRNELLHEYKRAKSFLLSETSTVKGSEAFYKGIQNRVGADRPLSDKEIEKLYSILDKYMESYAYAFYKKGKTDSVEYQESIKVQRKIWDLMSEGKDESEILLQLGVLSDTENESRHDTSEDFTLIGKHHPFN